MKKTLRYCLIWYFFAIGCHDDGPTAPKATPTPTPTPVSLSGTWTGTEGERGLTDDFLCPGGVTSISVQIAQSGSAVSFSVPTGGRCLRGGVAIFQGTLNGNQLNGTLLEGVEGSCVLQGVAQGTAQASEIHLAGHLKGSCNAVRVDLDLMRLLEPHLRNF